jgi:nitrate/TMAO reductase-like tetraheme cytochrome c subunit
LLIIAVVAIGLYLLFMGVYLPTSEPSFCTSCHEIKPYMNSWRNSAHNNVKCLYCHEFRGFVGKLHSKTRGLNYLYQQWTGQYTILTKGQIFEHNCIACHLGDYWNYPNTKKLDMRHFGYIKQNKSCSLCHREPGHKAKIFSSDKFKK